MIIIHKKNNKRIASIALISFIILVNLFLFRGSVFHGMEFDEVYRINNLFPLLHDNVYPYDQSIYSLNVGGISIPLMYKDYISSACLLTSIPVAVFDNTLVTLRSLYVLYTVCFELLLYFFIRKYNQFVAAASTSFIAVCPLLFPYIRYGWANLTYGIILLSAFYFAFQYKEKDNRLFLFFSAMSFAFLVNVYFYCLWIIGGLFAALLLLFPKRLLRFFRDWKNLTVTVLGFFVGLFNFILYNINKGFPALKILFNYLFRIDTYNKTAIDGKSTTNLLGSFSVKLKSYQQCIGPYKDVFLFLLLCLLFVYVFFFLLTLKKNQLQEKKTVFFFPIVTIVSFTLMLISPNSQGSHHLTFIIITLGLSIAIGLWLMCFELGINKRVVIIIACLICAFNLYQSHISVQNDIKSNGNGYFSEKIFDLVDYVKEEPFLNDNNVKFIEWGFSSQFYFLNNGNFQLDDITFGIRNRTEKEREEYLNEFFQRLNGDIFVPVYYSDQKTLDVQTIVGGKDNNFSNYMDEATVDYTRSDFNLFDVERVNDPVKSFVHYVWKNDGEVSVLKFFADDDGSDIALLRISNINRIKQRLLNSRSQRMEQLNVSKFQKHDEYEYLYGFYDYESSSKNRWVQKNSYILLNRSDHNHLFLKFWVPLINKRDEPETYLCISVDDFIIYNEKITDSNLRELCFSLDDIPIGMDETAEIHLDLNSKVLSEIDKRELAMCIEEISFID